MEILWAALSLGIMAVCLTLTLFTLPGNWLALLVLCVWQWTHPSGELGWQFIGGMALLAAGAEVVELLSHVQGAKRFGASRTATFLGCVGAFAGAIFGAGFGFGIGAIPGGVLGAFLAILAWEAVQGRNLREACRAAIGGGLGVMLGLSVKGTVGAIIFVMSASRIWP